MAPKPQIPLQLVKKIKRDPELAGDESIVFSASFHRDMRLEMCKRDREPSGHPDFPIFFGDDTPQKEEDQRSYLHAAVVYADILLACEMVRAGANVDLEDDPGYTPLLLAMHNFHCGKKGKPASLKKMEPKMHVLAAQFAERHKSIAIMLLEQHANPNVNILGITPLHYACFSQDWDLIVPLLEHGASPNPLPGSIVNPPAVFLSPSSRPRFIQLAQFYSSRPRPPRLCPCFSGLTLANCHAEYQPFPAHFYCHCGSAKTYKRCCGAGQKPVFIIKEKWDSQAQEWLYLCHVPDGPGDLGKELEIGRAEMDRLAKLNRRLNTLRDILILSGMHRDSADVDPESE